MKNKNIQNYIKGLIEDVKKNGDSAVRRYTLKWDKTQKRAIKSQEISSLTGKIDPFLKKSLNLAAKNISDFHKAELKNIKKSWFVKKGSNTLGQVYTPIESVGLYVPGGLYTYPSTVLMGAIPAKIAGVKRIVIVTPPKQIKSAVLYAAKLCGIKEIYGVNGPAGIAALAYGTKTIPKVDMIVGPGSEYINEAKRQVFGVVGIDSLAGSSEVAIIADSSVKKENIVTDILAQVEHDPMAKAYVYTDSKRVIEDIKREIPLKYKKQIKELKLCKLSDAVKYVNSLAPEHLEIMTKNPKKAAKQIKNAGAIFVGEGTPNAVGDYWAGPSHILPTGRTARFSGGLSVSTFLKKTSYIDFSLYKNAREKKYIERLAEEEGLAYHKKSVSVRN